MDTIPKRERWFNLGAETFRKWATANGETHLLREDGEHVYPCPLCKERFTKAALTTRVLSLEHVPPEDVGGKEMVLTCKPCNNTQGGRFDGHALRREKWVDSRTGKRIWPFDGEQTTKGIKANFEIYEGPGQFGMAYICHPKKNNLSKHEEYTTAFSELLRSHQTVSVRVDGKFVWAKAELSYARAAYLASFAMFGWAHIFRPAFEPLRQLLQTKDGEGLPDIEVYQPPTTSTDNAMALVTEPGPLQGVLLVRMARSTIALPGPSDDRTLDEVAAAVTGWKANMGRPVEVHQLYDWPTEPLHRLDIAMAQES